MPHELNNCQAHPVQHSSLFFLSLSLDMMEENTQMLFRFEEVINRRYSRIKSLGNILIWQHGWMEEEQR